MLKACNTVGRLRTFEACRSGPGITRTKGRARPAGSRRYTVYMMGEIKGKTIAVVGASRGIGQEVRQVSRKLLGGIVRWGDGPTDLRCK